jgi:hypothetical protein
MSNPKDRKDEAKDDLFAQQAGALFRESADSLDGQAQSRLNRSRQAALAELDSSTVSTLNRWTQWAPAAGAAAVAVVAVVLLTGNPETVNPGTEQLAGDFELLMAADSFDMLQELEFYSWIDIDAELDGESATGADVG